MKTLDLKKNFEEGLWRVFNSSKFFQSEHFCFKKLFCDMKALDLKNVFEVRKGVMEGI